jgi:hypothetical protein
MGSMEELEALVEDFVDLRTEFGKKALERVGNLRGPRITALRELIKDLKSKGIETLKAPLRFRLVDFEKGKKYEIVGESIAGPGLNKVYRYSISYADSGTEVRAGQVLGVGQVASLGEIEVGSILKNEFSVLLPVFGDDRYEEFFSPSGREKRKKETTKEIRKTMDDVILEQLGNTGYDVTEASAYLQEFFQQASKLDKGNDVLWLRRQIENGKIADKNLVLAYFDVTDNIDYSNDSAVLVSHAIMEQRKRSAKGLLGRLREDLLFLDEKKGIYDVNLDKEFERRVYYPEKSTLKQGTVRQKLNESSMSFSEALGIVRLFPGITEARTKFNRQNAEKFFGEGQTAVAGLNKALDHVTPYLEEDKKTYHKAKLKNTKPNLKLGKSYKLAKEIDELSSLDDQRGKFANLIRFIGFRDSEKTFLGLYTLDSQLRLAESRVGDKLRLGQESVDLEFAGVMATSYVNNVEFRNRHGLDLADVVLRINDVDEILIERKYPPSNGTIENSDNYVTSKSEFSNKTISKKGDLIKEIVYKTKGKTPVEKEPDKGYSSFRENLERITREAKHNLVSVDFEEKLARYGKVLETYQENKGRVNKDLDKLVRFAEALDLSCEIDLQKLAERSYLSSEEIARFQDVRTKLSEVKEFKGLKPSDVTRLGELRKQVEEELGLGEQQKKSIYGCTKGKGLLIPQYRGFFSPYGSHEGIIYLLPKELEARARLINKSKSAQELGDTFLNKLEQIRVARDKISRSKKRDSLNPLDILIKQVKETPDRVLILDELISEVDLAYDKVQKGQDNPYQSYFSYIDKESQSLAGTGTYYDISAYGSSLELTGTFSKSKGGIGYLIWKPHIGWHQTKVSEDQFDRIMEEISKKKANVKIKINKVYET